MRDMSARKTDRHTPSAPSFAASQPAWPEPSSACSDPASSLPSAYRTSSLSTYVTTPPTLILARPSGSHPISSPDRVCVGLRVRGLRAMKVTSVIVKFAVEFFAVVLGILDPSLDQFGLAHPRRLFCRSRVAPLQKTPIVRRVGVGAPQFVGYVDGDHRSALPIRARSASLMSCRMASDI